MYLWQFHGLLNHAGTTPLIYYALQLPSTVSHAQHDLCLVPEQEAAAPCAMRCALCQGLCRCPRIYLHLDRHISLHFPSHKGKSIWRIPNVVPCGSVTNHTQTMPYSTVPQSYSQAPGRVFQCIISREHTGMYCQRPLTPQPSFDPPSLSTIFSCL